MKNKQRFAFSLLALAVNQTLYAADEVPKTAQTQEVTQFSEVKVTAKPVVEEEISAGQCTTTSDSALLLNGIPGVSLSTAGGISSLPAIHGLADDRIKIVVDGMQTTSACGNHMNAPLTYLPAASVSQLSVIAGITPVSQGGDSIAGTIHANTPAPIFANGSEQLHHEGNFSGYARSNNGAAGGSISGTIASDTVSVGITASTDHAGNYTDGQGNRITSTYYDARNVALNLAARGEGNLFTVKVGAQAIAGQGFVNQPMDMISNNAEFANLGYQGDFAWGKLNAKAYWQNTRHAMDVGRDKSQMMMPMFMPMKTQGKDTGYALKADLPLAPNNTLRVGNEFHRFALNDWWPPVAGTAPMMAPDTFLNINGARRDRFSLYAELETKLSPTTTSLVGVRNDRVKSDTGNVQGYSMMYAANAATFNAQPHARQDSDWDATALLKFEPADTSKFDVGYALKTRAPNLYERYTWATDAMSSSMIGWFGDGNFYVGNLNVKPEKAQTLSASADWHDASGEAWGVKVTPYYTYIRDYIGVNQINTFVYGSTHNQLQFANHNAQVYGVDLSGKATLSEGIKFKSSIAYLRGKDLTTGTNLYHQMPLNGLFTLEHSLSAWSNAIEWHAVAKKSNVDALRNEPVTGGYSLFNLRSSYQWQQVRLDVGVSNLFNKHYTPALGGVNYDNYLATGWMGTLRPLTGQGRSLNAGLSLKF